MSGSLKPSARSTLPAGFGPAGYALNAYGKKPKSSAAWNEKARDIATEDGMPKDSIKDDGGIENVTW